MQFGATFMGAQIFADHSVQAKAPGDEFMILIRWIDDVDPEQFPGAARRLGAAKCALGFAVENLGGIVVCS